MFTNLTARICLGLISVVAASSAAKCNATEYGAFVLQNPTSVPIYYQVKWGDGSWSSYCVHPGQLKWHSYELDENGQVPPPQVRFDCVAGDGQTTYHTYDMNVYATCNPSDGKPYVFRFSPCGTYLDLYCD